MDAKILGASGDTSMMILSAGEGRTSEHPVEDFMNLSMSKIKNKHILLIAFVNR